MTAWLLGAAVAAVVLALSLSVWPPRPARARHGRLGAHGPRPTRAAGDPRPTAVAHGPRPRLPAHAPARGRRLTSLPAVLTTARTRRAARRRAEALADDLPETAELLAIAAAAGCNVRLALEAVRRARDGPAVDVLAAVLADVDVGGRRLADALGRAPATWGEPVRPLTALLVDAERYGTPLGPALERLGDDLRQRRRRRAEERARQLPVRLLLPLVLCILPAFALLTVAPLLVSGLQSLADHQPTGP